jgi:mRNA interferase MazF
MRGEVWWLEPPDSKPRPALVLTREAVAHRAQRVTVADLTTNRRGLATEVDLDGDDGVPRPCVVTLDNVQTVRKAHLTRYITTLTPERMAQVCDAVKIAIAC